MSEEETEWVRELQFFRRCQRPVRIPLDTEISFNYFVVLYPTLWQPLFVLDVLK